MPDAMAKIRLSKDFSTPESDGNRPFIIPIFIPHAGCPHQCVFCDQTTITGVQQKLPAEDDIHFQIQKFLSYKSTHRGIVQVAFFGGNFLGLDNKTIFSFLQTATGYVETGSIDSIRFSTRPDTINDGCLEMLSDFPVQTIELGAQSMNDQVLLAAGRGHTAADTMAAVSCLKSKGYDIGLQMMVGLPDENEQRTLRSARKIASLKPDFVRIYPTLIFKNSRLAYMYQRGCYKPLSLQSCVGLVKKIYLIFRECGIDVIRMGLHTLPDFKNSSMILDGPYHPAFGHLVHSKIFLDKAASILKSINIGSRMVINVHPKSISRMRGLKNQNIAILKKRFDIKIIDIIGDHQLKESELRILGEESVSW